MINLLKPCLALLIFLIVFAFVHTMLTIITAFPIGLSLSAAIVGAAIAARFAWQLVAGTKMNHFIAIAGGASILGALCFTAGFLGPMIFAKETNQASMIGVFIAAPLGLIVGAIGGYIYNANQVR